MITKPFPTERPVLRAALLDAVSSISEVLAAHRQESEELRTLAPASVKALRASGLTRMKSPREVGGAEAHPNDQMDIIEALAMIDPAAAWSMFITSAVTGSAMSWLPDQAIQTMLNRGEFPFMAGSLRPGGVATPTAGGFRVSGRWGWGSGVRHADYVAVPAFAPDRASIVQVVVPIEHITIHDNWFVLGMKGTGSADYSIEDAFVPAMFASTDSQPRRGGALFRLGMPGYVVNEHGCFAYALARLALKTVTELAIGKKRGYGVQNSIADRPVFQRAVGEGEMRISAVRLLMRDVLDRLYEAAEFGQPPEALQAEARAAAVLCTDEAISITSALFRYAGGSAVMLDNLLQRCLRDLFTVQSHLVVSDVAYEALGQLRLGSPPDTH